jgi:5-methylcytosine-specific restriction endonuclease McrA
MAPTVEDETALVSSLVPSAPPEPFIILESEQRPGAEDHPAMTTGEKLARVARTDATFARRGPLWVGKCLICNGPVAFDARTGEGATLEHIRARTRGGTDDLANLAVVHGRCNGEKGRRWDQRRRRRADDYDAFIARLLERRQDRWREPSVDLPSLRAGDK